MRRIARLDIKNNALVKGINLEGLRVLGDPVQVAELYYSEGVEELFFMDVVASLYGRNSLVDVVESVAKNIFVPLTVAGGVRTEEDVLRLLDAGADKVAINTALTTDPALTDRLVSRFGSSTIVAAIEGIETQPGVVQVFTDNGRESTNLDVFDWAAELQARGIGEIIYTDVNSEGTGNGGAVETLERLLERLSVPLIYHGGIGKAQHVERLNQIPKLSGVCVSSLLHYNYIEEFCNLSANIMGNKDFLNKNRRPTYISPISVAAYNCAGEAQE